MYDIHKVPVNQISAVWHVIEEFIDDCLAISDGSYNKQQVLDLVLQGVWEVYIPIKENLVYGVIIVQPIYIANGKSALITIVAGKKILNKKAIAGFFSVLKNNGYTEMQGIVRDSMRKLLNRFGFTDRKTIVGVTL